jgi:Sulfotransferase domain
VHQRPKLAPDAARILVACMPKSGSTYLSTMIACLPQMRRGRLHPMKVDRREQELESLRLQEEEELTLLLRRQQKSIFNYKHALRRSIFEQLSKLTDASSPARIAEIDIRRGASGYVSQNHVRYSTPTKSLIIEYEMTPVVLVRDIFDAIVSLSDHLMNRSIYMSMGFFKEDMRAWPKEKVADFLVDMVAPWYINFFVSWQECPDKLLFTYEELTGDPLGCLQKVAAKANLSVSHSDCEQAVKLAKTKKTRLNKGVAGRGEELTQAQRERIASYARYYPGVDFSPIGISTPGCQHNGNPKNDHPRPSGVVCPEGATVATCQHQAP